MRCEKDESVSVGSRRNGVQIIFHARTAILNQTKGLASFTSCTPKCLLEYTCGKRRGCVYAKPFPDIPLVMPIVEQNEIGELLSKKRVTQNQEVI